MQGRALEQAEVFTHTGATLHLKLSSVLTALVLTGGLVYYSVDFSLLDSLLPQEGEEPLAPPVKQAPPPKKYAKKNHPDSPPTDDLTFFKTLSDSNLENYLGLDGKVKRQGGSVKETSSTRAGNGHKKAKRSRLDQQQNPSRSQNASTSSPAGELGKSTFTVQASSFRRLDRASALVERLKGKGYPAYFSTFQPQGEGALWYRVYLGKYGDHRMALQVADKAREEEDLHPMIIFNKE